MINSIESERLQRLIDRKTAQYEKLKSEDPENKALLYLSSEITLLRDTIMPIVLCNTTVDYSEIRDFVTRSIRRLEKLPLGRKVNDLVLHFHLKDSGVTKPIAAFASNMRSIDTIFIDMMINEKPESIYPYYFATPEFERIDKINNPTPPELLEKWKKNLNIPI